MTLALLPRPILVAEGADPYSLSTHTRAAGSEADLAALRRLLTPATGLLFEVGDEPGLALARDPALPPEHYTLDVDAAGVRIVAADDAAVLWALQTLRQLLGPQAFLGAPVHSQWQVPGVHIEDGPRFAWRGSHLDVGRHFFPFPDLLVHIDVLAAHKINMFHLHLTEDQGWRFESKRYPKLTEVGATRQETVWPANGGDGTPHGGYYTQDQLRALVRYAADRGITVVPEIEFPGHVSAALAAYPELAVPGYGVAGTATGFGVIDDVLNLSDAAMELVFGVWDEVLDVFPSRYVHIGGDECPTAQWVGNEAMEARARELGLASAAGLQRWFTDQLRAWLTERGRVAVGWDEIVDDGPVPGMVCEAWRDPAIGARAAEAGMDVIMAPTRSTYFDYYPSDLPEETYRIGGLLTTQDAYAFDPLADVAPQGRPHVLGTSAQLWTEYITTPREVAAMLWPRGCAHAEVAWSPQEQRSWDDFADRLPSHLERLAAWGIDYRPEAGPQPWQQGGTGRRARPADQPW